MKSHLSAYLIFAKDVNIEDSKSIFSMLDKERTYSLYEFRDCFSESLHFHLRGQSTEEQKGDEFGLINPFSSNSLT